MADLFYSPRLTLVNAQRHIRDFKSLVDGFIQSNPWARFIDKDSEPGMDIHKIGFTQEFPDMLPCLLFDVTNNLRAVLDQAGYASAIAAKSHSVKATKFPFGPTEDKFRQNLAGGCKDLPAEIRSIFERSNAYEGGDSTLWALNEIANAKKHLALIPLHIGGARADFSARVPENTLIGRGKESGWDSAKKEITLLTVSAGLDPHISGRFTFDIAIQGIKVLRGQPAVGVLQTMSQKVESILVATEAECRRLFPTAFF